MTVVLINPRDLKLDEDDEVGDAAGEEAGEQLAVDGQEAESGHTLDPGQPADDNVALLKISEGESTTWNEGPAKKMAQISLAQATTTYQI